MHFRLLRRSRTSTPAAALTSACIVVVILYATACHEPTSSGEKRLALPLTDRIVFESNRADSLDDIFAMKLDGSDPIALTDETTADACPALSPDGQWIAFYGKPAKDSTP